MDIDILYPLVTEAIRRAEVCSEIGAPGAKIAYQDVSRLEEEIAKRLRGSDYEGAVARRGAVRAAIKGGEPDRAEILIISYLAESDLDPKLKSDLEGFKQQLATMLPPGFPAGQAVFWQFRG